MAALLLASSCASYSPPPEVARDLRPIEFASRRGEPLNRMRSADFELDIEDERLRVRSDNYRRRTWPRDTIHCWRDTRVSLGPQWTLRCKTYWRVEGRPRAVSIFQTTALQTKCWTEGEQPNVNLTAEDWPRVDGAVAVNARDYRLHATEEYEDRPAALILTRGPKVVMIVAENDRIWLRKDLDRDEAQVLTRLAIALWAAPELRLR